MPNAEVTVKKSLFQNTKQSSTIQRHCLHCDEMNWKTSLVNCQHWRITVLYLSREHRIITWPLALIMFRNSKQFSCTFLPWCSPTLAPIQTFPLLLTRLLHRIPEEKVESEASCTTRFSIYHTSDSANNSVRIPLTLSDAVWDFLGALQCDARSRYSRGRLVEETEERGGRGTERKVEKMLLQWTLGTFFNIV